MKKNLKIIIILVFLVLSFILFSFNKKQEHKVVLANNQVVVLDSTRWKALENTQDNAINFERKERLDTDVFKQIITIYDQPLSNSKKATLEQLGPDGISPTTYLVDFFRIHDDGITTQIIYDHGPYYVMSRQTYHDTTGIDPEVSPSDLLSALSTHSDNIESTIYTLKNIFSVKSN